MRIPKTTAAADITVYYGTTVLRRYVCQTQNHDS